MNHFVSKPKAVFICFILLLQWTSTALADGLSVEQVQRDFMARYKAVTGREDFQWLPSKPDNGTPAPQYPGDGFYGDLKTDPDKALHLVQQLVDGFYRTNIIFTHYLKINAFSDLEGQYSSTNSFPKYSASDMHAYYSAADVTSANCWTALSDLEKDLQKLKFVLVCATQVVTNNYLDNRYIYSYQSSANDCAGINSCVQSFMANTHWGNAQGFHYDGGCVPDDDEWALPTGLQYELYGMDASQQKISAYFGSAKDTSDGSDLLEASNVRGKISADLSNIGAGTVKVFLRLARVNTGQAFYAAANSTISADSVFSQAPHPISMSDAENTYGEWSDGVLDLGYVTTSHSYVTGSETPPQALDNCAPSSDVETLYGWEVEDAVAVVAPDFTAVREGSCPCANVCKPGTIDATLSQFTGAPQVNIGLGTDQYGRSAGFIKIFGDIHNEALPDIHFLQYSVADSVQVYSDGYVVTEFKTSQALIDITQDIEDWTYILHSRYKIRVYDSANWGHFDPSYGFYNGRGTPSTTIIVEDPNDPGIPLPGLTINPFDALHMKELTNLRFTRTDTVNSETTVTDYTFTTDNSVNPPKSGWTMTTGTGTGTRTESRISSWNTAHTIRTETHSIQDASAQSSYSEVNTYQLFGWGQELVQQVVGSGGAALTSTWHYYSDFANDGGNYRQLKDYTDADGHWTRFEYDSIGRQTKQVEQFQNSAITSAETVNRVISTAYSATAPHITTIEKLQDHEIARHYQVVSSDEVDDIACQTVNAPYNASDNMTTVTKRNTSGAFAGEPSCIQHPDGTMEFYTSVIDSGTRTDTVDSGQPNSGKTAIVDGTRTITIKNSVGRIISRTVKDLVASRTPSEITLSSETYSDYDEFNRPRRITYLDGTHTETYYGCCGVNTTTDRDGVVTQYIYDALHRQYGYIRNGIKYENIMNPAGQVIKELRTGSDTPPTVVTNRTAGYDLAGRLNSETNALNGKTSYTDSFNSAGQRIHITTYPDLGTRVETNNLDGTLVSVTGTAVFPVRYEYGFEQDGGVWRSYTKEIKMKLDGTDSSEWTKTYTDMAGRAYKTVFAAATTPYPYSQSFYNNQGQLWKQRDPDGVETVFQYNAKGEPEYTALDVDHNATSSQPIVFTGNNRISRVVRTVVAAAGGKPNLIQVDNYVWKDGNSTSTGTLVSRSQTSTDGLKTWTTVYRDTSTPVTSRSETVYGTSRTVTEYAPDSSYVVSVYSSGQLQSVTAKDSTGAQIGARTYTYDAHGRQKTAVDVRNGTTTYNYTNADLVLSVTTPAPGNGAPAQTTTTYYNTMLQVTNTVNPDGTRATNEYFVTGTLKKTYGSRTYPTEYTYDYSGRIATMKTWQNFSANSGTAVTSWNYDPYRGWLINKRYADTPSTGPDYTYTPGGRLKTRTWARTGTSSQRITTTYSYGFDDGVSGNDHGDLVSVVYANDPQSTPSTTYAYDRLGRQSTLSWNGTTETLTYNDANELLTDSSSGGTLNGLTVTSGYDTYLRRQSLSLNTASALTTTFGYDNASRLQTVNDGNNNSATYTYVANSPLVSQIVFKQSTTTRMTTTKLYDHLNRLTNIASSPSTLSVAAFGYAYNLANQRTQRTEIDGNQWRYQYDSLGQVKSAKKYWANSTTPLEGQQFTYTYDDIGNRISTTSGGNEAGANLRTAAYTANSLNQYSQRDVPAYLDIIGMALVTDTVTVNSQSTYRSGQYFRKELSVANSSAPVWQSVTVAGTGVSPVTGNRFVAQTPEQFTYDLDGNLTQDGRWNYTWDAENRLLKVESLPGGPTASKRRVTWEYDCRGRRIRQTTYDGSSGSYVMTEDLKFVSDGWNLIAELAAADNAIVRSYLWGCDLSGSVSGAGGVGGLLAMSYRGTATTNAFVAHDGNGNVSALVNATDGSLVAKYEYDPFGNLLRASGPMAKLNPIRFSSKYQDSQCDLIYFGYRYYNANTGRWLGRDPIEEQGGKNLYGMVGNDPQNQIDFLGLADTELHHVIPEWLANYSAYGARSQGFCIRLTQQFHRGPGGLESELTQIRNLLRSGAINQFGAYNRVLLVQLRNLPAIIRNNRAAVGISGGSAVAFQGAVRAGLAQVSYFTYGEAALGATGVGTVAIGGFYLTGKWLEYGEYKNYNLEGQSEIDLYNAQVGIASRAAQLDGSAILSVGKTLATCSANADSECARKFQAALNRNYFFIQTMGVTQYGVSMKQARDAVAEELFIDYLQCLKAAGCCMKPCN